MTRKRSSILIIFCFVFMMGAPACAIAGEAGFADVNTGDWYADAVLFCQQNGIMNGTTESGFAPDEAMSRAMFVTALYRAAGAPVVTMAQAFADTEPESWYSAAVSWAVDTGLISGYDDGTFGTNDPVSREQIAAVLWRHEGSPQVQAAAFADQHLISEYALPAAAWARANNVITGQEGNIFAPHAPAARAQVAVMLHRYLMLEQDKTLNDAEEGGNDMHVISPNTGSTFNFETKTVMLNSGYEMPINGIGTYSLTDDVCVSSVSAALACGVRLIDTAYMYHNEAAVGQAVRDSGIPREEIFVVTKLYPNQFANAEAAIDEAMQKLDIGYIDLMLLHHPGTHDVEAYHAMERAVEAGKIRSIGLSNWYVKELEAFLPQVNIMPALVQNEIHPYYQENDVIPYIQSLGIVVQGWYPLGGRGYTAALLGNEVISEIAAAHGVSSAQVILRWNLQKGVVVIPGSSNPEHIRENTQLYHFELTDEEMKQINALDRGEKHDWY